MKEHDRTDVWLSRYKYFCQTVKFCMILSVINRFNKEKINRKQKNSMKTDQRDQRDDDDERR